MNHPTKHIICLWAVLFVGSASVASFAAQPSQPLDLNGREVVVRVYNDWKLKLYKFKQWVLPQDEPEVFEKITVEFKGNSLRLESIEPAPAQSDKSTVVVIIAEDQNDTLVKKALDDAIYAQPYEQGLTFSLPRARQIPSVWLTFSDALGDPIPQATVQIFLSDNRNQAKASIRNVLLDDKGRMAMPTLTGSLNRLALIISHPDYGIAFVEEVYPWSRKTYLLPLSKTGTQADQRSIWGVVVDPQGNPVQGALISGCMAYTPGRGKIRARDFSNMVLTDPNGQFAMHLPVEKTEYGPATIPPICDYEVLVKAPKALNLMPYSGLVRNGQGTTIVLQKRPEMHLRTFAFEDEAGPITDPNWLKEIIIIEGTGHGGRTYEYDSWKDGLMLPTGIHRAAIRTTGPEKHELDRVELTAESPQQIIFRIGNDVTYAGKVVDGITGQPVAGAFIMATGDFENDFSSITAEQWVALHELPTYLAGDEPALDLIRKICDFERITRSESDGTFYLSFGPSDKFYQLIVFAQDCLHFAHRRDLCEPDQYNYVQLPESRLYPAAKLRIELYAEVKERNSPVVSWWYIDEDNNPAWVEEFQACCSGPDSFTHLQRHLEVNMPQVIQVPAQMNVQLRLVYIDSGGGKMFWCPVYTEVFNAAQGETLNLGQYRAFEQEMPIYVEVVDSAGNPLEGIGVAHSDTTGAYFGQTHITDATGIAQFTVPPYYKGEFSVGNIDENKKYIKQSIFYETKGPQDANNVYTLRVSDEILYHLFK